MSDFYRLKSEPPLPPLPVNWAKQTGCLPIPSSSIKRKSRMNGPVTILHIDQKYEVTYWIIRDEVKIVSKVPLKKAIELLERNDFDLIFYEQVRKANEELQTEIRELKPMGGELRKDYDALEVRFQERTADLSMTAARLGQLNRELEEFAFIASHDLQEPLRKIETFSDMVKKRGGPRLDKTSQDYLDRVIKSASHMRHLLGDLLKLSKIITELKPFHAIDLFSIVKEVREVFEAPLKETGGRIEVDKMPVIEADETQLRQLFQNLFGNALKFRDQNKPLIRVYGHVADHGFYEIFVKDNGIGFDPEFAERIFIPFERLHGRNEYEGTGMGLAICRKIVERHGGTIRAESEPGKGSTFIIKLPLKQVGIEKSRT
jgi:light-regulated signal transduction histidine kinase (bacteriophytochrome)